MEDPASFEEDYEDVTATQPSPIPGDFSPSIQNQDMLLMTVEIGDGRQDVLTIHESDDPQALAYDFSKKHGLGLESQQILARHIIENQSRLARKTISNTPVLNNSNEISEISAYSYQRTPHNNSQKIISPLINQKSKRIVNRMKRQGNVHDRLYQQAQKYHKSKQTVPSEQVSFINTSRSSTASSINYGEWLYTRGMKMKEQRERKINEAKRQIDQEASTQYSFRPTINRNSEVLAPPVLSSTVDQLIKKGREKREKIQALQENRKNDELEGCTFQPNINSRSKQLARQRRNPDSPDPIFLEYKRKAYQQLFSQLDSDGDGVISSEAIEIEGLSLEALDLLEPIFQELEDSGTPLEFDAFEAMLDVLFDMMTLEEKKLLFARKEAPELQDASNTLKVLGSYKKKL